MNKTVTINISGIIFHIEEDAYEKLFHYLTAIKHHFASDESGNEIIADIEARIAELLQPKVSKYKQAVLMADVEEVIAALGSPSDFGINEQSSASEKNNNSNQEFIKKRIFRDPDEKAIGGVCSGLANYFDVDVVWVRLITFLLIFFGGISFWIYIILWIVIPEAKTTSDKLAMKGEKINVDNISKSLKEEMHGVKSRMETYGKEFSKGLQKTAKSSATLAERFAYLLGNLFHIMGRVLGAVFIFLSIIFLVAIITSFFGVTFFSNQTELQHWIDFVFPNKTIYRTSTIALLITLGVPALMMLYSGIKLLFKIKYHNKWLNISAAVLWLGGLIMLFFSSMSTLKDFSEEVKSRETEQFTSSAPCLTISANSIENWCKKNNITLAFSGKKNDEEKWDNNYFLAENNNQSALVGTPELKILKSANEYIEVVINKKARGADKKTALNRAADIFYSTKADSTGIVLDPFFYLTSDQKFRSQQVEILIKIPEGKTIYIDGSVSKILDEAENINDAYEENMCNRKWKMTELGLKCIDCDDLESATVIRKVKSKQIIITEDGVKIKRKNIRVLVDKNGVEIKEEQKEKEEEN